MIEKLCPLLSSGKESATRCQGDRCAWYCPAVEAGAGRCAVLDLVSVTAGVMYPYLQKQEETQ